MLLKIENKYGELTVEDELRALAYTEDTGRRS